MTKIIETRNKKYAEVKKGRVIDACKNCINFKDTGHVVDGWCACCDHFVLKTDKSCYDFEDNGEANDVKKTQN